MELYIHIPFCMRKCRYCDFLSFAGKEVCYKDYVFALCRELEGLEGLVREKGLDTVFIGGGTPSLLPAEMMTDVLEAVDALAKAGGKRIEEYTVECNPGTVDAGKLALYRAHGVNRLSFGLQSASDDELKMLGRIHCFGDFTESFRLARGAGFDNINVDLMSAIPGQKPENWEKTLRTVAELGPEHISAYSLIIEPGTPFFEIYGESREPADGYAPLPTEDEERAMYRDTARILAEYGYHRYEISNYAKKDRESKHNLGYWTGAEYAGAGLGAASYMLTGGKKGVSAIRYSDTDDLDEYINVLRTDADCMSSKRTGMSAAGPKRPGAEGHPHEDIPDRRIKKEVTDLDRDDMLGEYMMLRLRLTEGFELSDFEARFGESFFAVFGDTYEKHRANGLLKERGGRVMLTERGLDLANLVMADFLNVQHRI